MHTNIERFEINKTKRPSIPSNRNEQLANKEEFRDPPAIPYLEAHGRGSILSMRKNESESKVSILLPLRRNNETNPSARGRKIISPGDVRPNPPRGPAALCAVSFWVSIRRRESRSMKSCSSTRFSGLSENFVSLGWKTPKEGRYLIATYKIFSICGNPNVYSLRKWALSFAILCRAIRQVSKLEA